eukprot:9862760-Alexandrium_andersonii.AAC.1
MVVIVACHCRNPNMVMTMVVVTTSPKRAQNWYSKLSRGPFCAVGRAEREYGNEHLPRARLGLVLDGFSG